jgi:hypothetical protein
MSLLRGRGEQRVRSWGLSRKYGCGGKFGIDGDETGTVGPACGIGGLLLSPSPWGTIDMENQHF